MIEIRINTETADEARQEMARLLGTMLTSVAGTPAAQKAIIEAAVNGEEPEEVAEKIVAAANVKRERGKPAPGRSRRTKEEIAEDEAAEKAEASGTQAISTGGERVSPEDEPEVQEQDKADEQAEVEASRSPEKPLTVDDVKAAVGLYVNKFGMPATNEDGPAIFVKALGQPPEGNPFWKMSILPDDQKKLKACVDEWSKAAAADARYGQ